MKITESTHIQTPRTIAISRARLSQNYSSTLESLSKNSSYGLKEWAKGLVLLVWKFYEWLKGLFCQTPQAKQLEPEKPKSEENPPNKDGESSPTAPLAITPSTATHSGVSPPSTTPVRAGGPADDDTPFQRTSPIGTFSSPASPVRVDGPADDETFSQGTVPFSPPASLNQDASISENSSPKPDSKPLQNTPSATPCFSQAYMVELTHEQMQDIRFTLETLAKGYKSAWDNSDTLYITGERLKKLHSLRFLEYILNNLKDAFNTIPQYDSFFMPITIWKRFRNETGENIENWRRSLPSTFTAELQDFAKKFNLDFNLLRRQIEEKTWDGFLKYLINKK